MGHCWRSKADLISDVLLWVSLPGRARLEGPATTYLQQLCTDTESNMEDLLKAMDDREEWQVAGQGNPCQRRAMIYIYIYIYICVCVCVCVLFVNNCNIYELLSSSNCADHDVP